MRLAWWSDKRHDVSWQQTPPDGLGEGAVQDGMQMADRPWGNEFCVLQPNFPEPLPSRRPWTT
jgi:hypothetical protein